MEKQIKLVLDTDYKRTGNSDGMQISTLSLAVFGCDWEDIYANSLVYLDEVEQTAMREYVHEADFLASLTPAEAAQYIADSQGYAEALDEYGEAKEEAYRQGELPEADPFYKHVRKNRDWSEENMRDEWIDGDRSSLGVLGEAAKTFEGFEFFYFKGSDEITFTVEQWKRDELLENEEIAVDDDAAIAKWLASDVEETAGAKHNKKLAARTARKAEQERLYAYHAGQAAKKEEARKEKLRAIAEGNA